MDELVEEFQRLIQQRSGNALAGSIELLLQQMEPDAADQLRLCAIPHQFNPSLLRVLAPSLDASQAEQRCAEFARLSIMIDRQPWLAMHDDARRYLFSVWLTPQNASDFASASARLVAHFDPSAADVSGEALEIIEHRRMFHLLGAGIHLSRDNLLLSLA